MPAGGNTQTSPFDLVVFGATSFVGQLVVAYLADFLQGADTNLNWAIAGRSATKLEGVRQSLGAVGDKLPMIIADTGKPEEVNAMCQQTRVLLSTVGPYALYGEPVVKACAENGTDYCDLTGEVQWIRQMMKRYGETARKSGARLVHCCGFDSIPSDLGVHFLQQQSKEKLGAPAVEVSMRIRALKGGISGGTAASLVNAIRESSADAETRKSMLNPFTLCLPTHDFVANQQRVGRVRYDKHFNNWLAPFVMGAINEAIVRRSNQLSEDCHSRDFVYNEAMLMGDGTSSCLKAWGFTAGLGSFMAGAFLPPTRYLLEKLVLPKPGDGPNAGKRESGFYDLRFHGKTGEGKILFTKVTGQGDPGYASTSKMLGQAALCLSLDCADKAVEGGFWTPASLFGDKLLERLSRHAGLRFEVM